MSAPIHLCRALACALIAAAMDASAADDASVQIQKFAFAPQEITIKPGAKVVWINHDETPHAVLSPDKEIKSPALDTDDRYEHVFANPGDFRYVCTLHPYMSGVVHVHP